jgi:hypothetical protein
MRLFADDLRLGHRKNEGPRDDSLLACASAHRSVHE